jgi:phosphoribosylamine--glycine ligase
MNSGFFATADGVRVIEFNARFGDPECINIMALLDGGWPEVMRRICTGELARGDVSLRAQASLVLYLVSPDYALPTGRPPTPREFELDLAAIERDGCEVFFASSEQVGANAYRTIGTSRAVALATTAPTLAQAHERIVACAGSVDALQWRREVGDERYLAGLTGLVAQA